MITQQHEYKGKGRATLPGLTVSCVCLVCPFLCQPGSVISVGCDCDAVLPCCPPKHTKSHLPLQFLYTHRHTHSHTCLRTYTRHTQTHTFTPFTPSLLVAPISGFSVSIILLVWTGLIISVCVCAAVCLSVPMHCILMLMLVCGRHSSWSCDF